MFGHMMSQADEIMVGYRYQYSNQGGSMLHGSDSVSDQALVNHACNDFSNGCLYKPASMNMQMHMLDLMYAPTDWLNIMLMPQLIEHGYDDEQPYPPLLPIKLKKMTLAATAVPSMSVMTLAIR